jgi:hypothetical protein
METREEVCSRFGVVAEPPGLGEKRGIALASIGEFPINGLRVHLDGRQATDSRSRMVMRTFGAIRHSWLKSDSPPWVEIGQERTF